MGLFSFIKEAGQAIGIGDGDSKQAETESKAALEAVLEKKRAKALEDMIAKMGVPVTDLSITVKGDHATLHGMVGSQEDREKLVLLVGNTRGIGTVEDALKFGAMAATATATMGAAATATATTPGAPAASAPLSVLYTVQAGDTLSKIAKQQYGSSSKYHAIFEANKPMLKSADLIYPGQVLRIPPQA